MPTVFPSPEIDLPLRGIACEDRWTASTGPGAKAQSSANTAELTLTVRILAFEEGGISKR